MKTRIGYVSNSSSSSFVCDVCGEEGSGWDASASDFDMVQCIKEHTFCESEGVDRNSLSLESLKKILETHISKIAKDGYASPEDIDGYKKTLSEAKDEDDLSGLFEEFEDDGVLPQFCPICSLKALKPSDGYAYLMRKNESTKQSLLEEITNKFETYEAFQAYICPPKK
jgi:hypothetical protein